MSIKTMNMMTPEQFKAITTLLRMQDKPSRQAAELVLVHNRRPAEASRQAGCSPSATGNAIRRIKAGIETAKRAVTPT